MRQNKTRGQSLRGWHIIIFLLSFIGIGFALYEHAPVCGAFFSIICGVTIGLYAFSIIETEVER